jgi:hypothetical protein
MSTIASALSRAEWVKTLKANPELIQTASRDDLANVASDASQGVQTLSRSLGLLGRLTKDMEDGHYDAAENLRDVAALLAELGGLIPVLHQLSHDATACETASRHPVAARKAAKLQA